MLVEIINGDHIPNWPLIVVDGKGVQVDLAGVPGELWDPNNVARIDWGLLSQRDGRTFGRITLKNGQKRTFWDKALIQPYLQAYAVKWAAESAKHAANVAERKAKQAKAAARDSADGAMVRAIREKVEQGLPHA